ncbi:MAG: SDR family oxidoreductase [Phycisphaerales bacterium]|nr:SDR family oxidoreductase [Phycisphaerales bacterium]
MSTEREVALITGGGTGIGRATAKALVGQGWDVIINGRRPDVLAEAIDEIEAGTKGEPGWGSASQVAGDVAMGETRWAIIDQVRSRHGRLDALVHCAGHAAFTPLGEASVSGLQGYMGVHTEAALDLVTQAWDLLRAQGLGRVVLVSSMSAHDPFPGLGVYGMAKAALEALARAVAVDGDGAISAWALAVGCVDTPMLRQLVGDDEALQRLNPAPPESVAAVVGDLLAGRRGEPSGATIMADQF